VGGGASAASGPGDLSRRLRHVMRGPDPRRLAVSRRRAALQVLAVEACDDKAASRLAALQQSRVEGRASPASDVDRVVLKLDEPSLALLAGALVGGYCSRSKGVPVVIEQSAILPLPTSDWSDS
jgi:hypothetical protein